MTPQELATANSLLRQAERAAESLSAAKASSTIDALEWRLPRDEVLAPDPRTQMLEACRSIAVEFHTATIARLQEALRTFGVELTDDILAAHVAEHEELERQYAARREAERLANKKPTPEKEVA